MASSSLDREKEEGELTDDDEGFVTVVRKKQSSHANNHSYKYRKGGYYGGGHNNYGTDTETGREFKTNKNRRNFNSGDRRKGDQRGGRRYQEDRDRDKADKTESDGKATQDKQNSLPSSSQSSSSTVTTSTSQSSASSTSGGPTYQSVAASALSNSLHSSGKTVQAADNKVITNTQPPVPEVPIRRAFAEVISSNLPSQSQTNGSGSAKNNSNSLNKSGSGGTVTSSTAASTASSSPAPSATNIAIAALDMDIVQQQKLQEVPTTQPVPIRRAFSEVTKANIKSTGISKGGSSSSSTRATRGVQTRQEDWPSLQETIVSSPSGTTPSSTGTVSPSIAHNTPAVDNSVNAEKLNAEILAEEQKGKKTEDINNHKNSMDGMTGEKNAINGVKGDNKYPSNGGKEAKTNNSDNHVYVPRGRGRSNGGGGGNRGRGGRSDKRSGRGSYQNNWVNYNGGLLLGETSPELKGVGDEYADYSTDYTTLPPMYPVTEFIMPYLFTPVFTPQPSGALVEETQITTSAYVPVDEAVLSDMIRKQIEYYFSEENLQKDFYLRRKMTKDGFLPVTFIASFPRIKTMTQDINVLVQAIQSSPELKLNKDLTCVRRVHEPNKWPIADEVSLVKAKSTKHRQKPPALQLQYTAPQNELTYSTNGYVALSPPLTADSTLNNNSAPFLTPSIADKLNPNVPEFVPKSMLMDTKS